MKMITIDIARRNIDPSQSEDLDGLHLFDVNIIRDDGISRIGSNTSVTIRPLLLLATGAPGHHMAGTGSANTCRT